MRLQTSIWLKWTIANIVGVACGWALGDVLSPWNATMAWLAFEVCIWFPRAVVLRHTRERSGWRYLDAWVWFSGELVGAVIGEGLHRLGGSTWRNAGQVFALTAGASVWIVLRVIQQSRGVFREAFLIAILRGLWGFLIASVVIGVTLVLALELGRSTGETTSWISRIISGALLGGLIGSMTGWVFAGFRRWKISSGQLKG